MYRKNIPAEEQQRIRAADSASKKRKMIEAAADPLENVVASQSFPSLMSLQAHEDSASVSSGILGDLSLRGIG